MPKLYITMHGPENLIDICILMNNFTFCLEKIKKSFENLKIPGLEFEHQLITVKEVFRESERWKLITMAVKTRLRFYL